MAVLTSCAFTGHRPSHFNFPYDKSAPGCIQRKAVLEKQILRLHHRGVTDFYTGRCHLLCVQVMLHPGRIRTVHSHGCIVQRSQQILPHIPHLGGVLFQTHQDKPDHVRCAKTLF